MEFHITASSGKPIYDQICEQVKAMVLTGRLKEGDALPSMRLLAKELRISVITTKRAYEELERQGFTVSVPGKGCFVAQSHPEQLREEHRRQIEQLLAQAAELARTAGIPHSELQEMLALQQEGD